jgi:4-hydroxy-2-oxoheptanedioate aldolase
MTPNPPSQSTPLNISDSNYLGEANDHIATLAMIETAQAMENLEEIVKVDGLDGVFIGGGFVGLCVGMMSVVE